MWRDPLKLFAIIGLVLIFGGAILGALHYEGAHERLRWLAGIVIIAVAIAGVIKDRGGGPKPPVS